MYAAQWVAPPLPLLAFEGADILTPHLGVVFSAILGGLYRSLRSPRVQHAHLLCCPPAL